MSGDFYLTLLSNSSYQHFPDNKTSSFTAKLPKSLELDGNYEVALCEIVFPQAIENVSQGNNSIIIETTVTDSLGDLYEIYRDEFKIEVGYYHNLDDLVFAVNQSLIKNIDQLSDEDFISYDLSSNRIIVNEKAAERIVKFHDDKWPPSVDFSKEAAEKNVKWSPSNDFSKKTQIRFENRLALQLGFTPLNCVFSHLASHQPLLAFGFSETFMVFMDIVEPQIVGDIYGQVLKTVQMIEPNFRFGDVCTRSYIDRSYIPVFKTSFETITVAINQSSGSLPVPFLFGTCYLQLHFRKVLKN